MKRFQAALSVAVSALLLSGCASSQRSSDQALDAAHAA